MHVARVKLIDKTPFIRQVKHEHVVVSNGRVCPWPQQLPVQGPETDEQPWYIISFRHNLSVVSPQRREFFYVGGILSRWFWPEYFAWGRLCPKGWEDLTVGICLIKITCGVSEGFCYGELLWGVSFGGLYLEGFLVDFEGRVGTRTAIDRLPTTTLNRHANPNHSASTPPISPICVRRRRREPGAGTWRGVHRGPGHQLTKRRPTSGDDVTSSSVGGDTRRRSHEPGETRQMLRVTRLFICTCDKLLTFLVWKL